MAKNAIDIKLTTSFNERLKESQAFKKAIAAMEAYKPVTVSSTEGTSATYPSWDYFSTTNTSDITSHWRLSTTSTAPVLTSFPVTTGWSGSSSGTWRAASPLASPIWHTAYDEYLDEDVRQELIDEVVADQIARHN